MNRCGTCKHRPDFDKNGKGICKAHDTAKIKIRLVQGEYYTNIGEWSTSLREITCTLYQYRRLGEFRCKDGVYSKIIGKFTKGRTYKEVGLTAENGVIVFDDNEILQNIERPGVAFFDSHFEVKDGS